MANESSWNNKVPPAPSPSPSNSSSSSSADSYIGSFISLISKYDIRYEGVLYCLNTHDSTIGLKEARCYGTEGRRKDSSEVPASDRVYEYILFRGSDIKDLQVKSPPTPQAEEHVHNDPAIIQTHYAGGPSSFSALPLNGKALEESTRYQDTPALTNRPHRDALSSYQSESQAGPSAHSQAAQLAGVPSFQTPMYWQGYNGPPISISNAPQHSLPVHPNTMSFPSMVQNRLQTHEIQASTTLGMTNTSERVLPVPPSVLPTSVHPNLSPTLTPMQYSASSNDMQSSLFLNPPMSFHSASMTANRPIMPSFPSFHKHTNTMERPMGSTSGHLLMPSQTLLTPNQLAQARSPALLSMQNQMDMGAQTPSTAVSTPLLQTPLLSLPPSAQQPQSSSTQFTEEFDFIAMNEKFKKEEIWGVLGKAKQRDRADGMEEDEPSYNKDEFFDTISCNSHNRGARNGPNRTPEQQFPAFGNFQQRPQGGYGGYGAERGQYYRGQYNVGRGYGYAGRGRGRN